MHRQRRVAGAPGRPRATLAAERLGTKAQVEPFGSDRLRLAVSADGSTFNSRSNWAIELFSVNRSQLTHVELSPGR
jgi:hypothetical protein